MKIDPNAPAYPQPWMTTGRDSDQYGGLTIRAELAARFMAASIAESGWAGKGYLPTLSEAAIQHADALIAALNAEPKP